MNREKLLQEVEKSDFRSDFLFDELGMTWQISFIRMVGGDKAAYRSAAHFYLSLIKAVEMHTHLAYGLSHWQFNVDLKTWSNGLVIERIDGAIFQKQLEEALVEIKTYENDWTGADEPIFFYNNIINPEEEPINYWKVEETVNPRLPVGPTYGYLAEFNTSYFYLEYHLES